MKIKNNKQNSFNNMNGQQIKNFFEHALSEMENTIFHNTNLHHETKNEPTLSTMIHRNIIPPNQYLNTDLCKEFVYLLNSLKWIKIDKIDHCDFLEIPAGHSETTENKYPCVLAEIMDITSEYLKRHIKNTYNEDGSISFTKAKCRYSNDKNNTILTYQNVKINTIILFFGDEVVIKASQNNTSQEFKLKSGDGVIISSDIDNTINVIREQNNACLIVFLYYKITL